MLRLIKAELYKLFKSRTFKILCVVTALLSTSIIGMDSMMDEEFVMNSMGDMPQEAKIQMIDDMKNNSNEDVIIQPGELGIKMGNVKDPFNITPLEMFHAAFGSGIIEILIGILVATMLAREYSQGTIKNTLAYGKKREHFYLAKFISITLGVAIMLIILTGIPLLVTTIMKGWRQEFQISQLLEIFSVFGGALVVSAAIVAIVMFIATLVKSNAATIGICVALFILAPTFAGFIYGNFSWFDKLYELTTFYNYALVTALHASSADILRAITISGATVLLALGCGVTMFKVQDIK